MLSLSKDNFWGTLMDGEDGTNYWTPSGIERKKKKEVKQNNI